jgi:hypothetical protein
MRFPLVGVASAMTAALGGYGLYWYQNLSRSEQEEADRLGGQSAQKLLGMSHSLPRLGQAVDLNRERLEG